MFFTLAAALSLVLQDAPLSSPVCDGDLALTVGFERGPAPASEAFAVRLVEGEGDWFEVRATRTGIRTRVAAVVAVAGVPREVDFVELPADLGFTLALERSADRFHCSLGGPGGMGSQHAFSAAHPMVVNGVQLAAPTGAVAFARLPWGEYTAPRRAEQRPLVRAAVPVVPEVVRVDVGLMVEELLAETPSVAALEPVGAEPPATEAPATEAPATEALADEQLAVEPLASGLPVTQPVVEEPAALAPATLVPTTAVAVAEGLPTEPITEPAPEPVAEPVAEPADERADEPAAERAAEPITSFGVDRLAQPFAFHAPSARCTHRLDAAGQLSLSVPAGAEHQCFDGLHAPAVLTAAPSGAFTFSARFDSDVRGPSAPGAVRLQGLVVELEGGVLLRCELVGDGARVFVAASRVDGTSVTPLAVERVRTEAPWTLAVTRTGEGVSFSLSEDERTTREVARATLDGSAATLRRVGVYAGNALGAASPAHTAVIGAVTLR